jgi:hypothetical protein
MTPIAPHISAFLRERLPHHRGASAHTCTSYAYSFQLLFEFASQRCGVTPSALALEQIDAPLVMDFLAGEFQPSSDIYVLPPVILPPLDRYAHLREGV